MPSLNSDNNVNININTKADTSGIDQVNGSVGGMSKGFQDNMKKVAIATGVAAAGLTAFAKNSTDYLVNLTKSSKDLARQTGLTVEQASSLTAAMSRVGVQSDQSNVAFRTFAKQITATADDSRTSATALDQLGIKVKDASGKTKDFQTILFETADKFKDMPNGVQKTTDAVDLFGRSGTSMIKVLNLGSAGIKDLETQAEKLGLTLTTKNIKSVSDYIESQKKLKDTTDSLKIAVGSLTAPVMTKFNDTLNDMLLKLISVDSPFRGVTADVLAFGGPILGAVSGITAFLGNLASALPILAKFGELLKLGAALDGIQAGFAVINTVSLPAFIAEASTASAFWVTAFPVAGILADIALVAEAVKSVLGAYKAVNDAQQAADNAETSYQASHARILDLSKNGTAAQKTQATKALKAGYASGGYTGRGGTDDVAGIVHKGEYVLPKSQVDQNTGQPKAGGNTFTIHSLVIQAPNNSTMQSILGGLDQDSLLVGKGLSVQRGTA